ncbi:hypothetical protein AGMMS50239_27670 [Bacteroidia bacterium]|nr:hypothetical protein AGMMS50239_27670 [Bacteroidia bacterium]
MKKINTIIAYILLLNTFVCCHKNGDNTYFNGNIRYIEDVKNETNVTLKAVPVEGANYGTFAVYDSLMIFWNSKLPNHFFNIFNLNTGEEMGSFCKKGGGPDEMFSVGIISRFYKEKNNLKTLLFAPNENKLFGIGV